MAGTHFSGPVYSDNGFTGLTFQGGSATPITADGAVPITTLISLIYPDGSDGSVALALTLADGEAGQLKIIKRSDGTTVVDCVVTPNDLDEGSTLTFDAADEVCVLVSDGASWHIVYNTADLA